MAERWTDVSDWAGSLCPGRRASASPEPAPFRYAPSKPPIHGRERSTPPAAWRDQQCSSVSTGKAMLHLRDDYTQAKQFWQTSPRHLEAIRRTSLVGQSAPYPILCAYNEARRFRFALVNGGILKAVVGY